MNSLRWKEKGQWAVLKTLPFCLFLYLCLYLNLLTWPSPSSCCLPQARWWRDSPPEVDLSPFWKRLLSNYPWFLLTDFISAYLRQHLVNLLWLFQFRCREGFILPFGPFLKIFKWIVEKMEATWRIYCMWPCSSGSCRTSSWSSGSRAGCASRSSGSWSSWGRTRRKLFSEACRSSSWDVTIKKSIVKPK